MKIMTCASYYGSGSSAIIDLISEYDNVKNLSDFEFRFLHDLDGIEDLEYHLVKNHNRHNSGHAIKRFQRLMNFNNGNVFSKRYSKYLKNDKLLALTDEYIKSLVDFEYPGWWFYDLYDKGNDKYYLYQIANHVCRKIPIDRFRILKNEKILCSHPDEKRFIEATKKYVSKLLNALNDEQKEYLVIDQLVPSANISNTLKYLEDETFVFVVDRDPRDVYLLEKYYWKGRHCPLDPEVFCKWFAYTHNAGNGAESNKNIVKIQFEDIIYNYERIEKLIENITGLKHENHIKRFDMMNPIISAINTQLWKKHDDKAVGVIENRLSDYLYNYACVDTDKIIGKESSLIRPF